MERCRFYMPGDGKTEKSDYTDARQGYFMQLGNVGGETVAVIRGADGRFYNTYTDYVQIMATPADELLAAVLGVMRASVARSRQAETEKQIVAEFEKIGFKITSH